MEAPSPANASSTETRAPPAQPYAGPPVAGSYPGGAPGPRPQAGPYAGTPPYPYYPPPVAPRGPPRSFTPPPRSFTPPPYYPGAAPPGPRPGAPGGPPQGPPPPGGVPRPSWGPPGVHPPSGYPPHHMGAPVWPGGPPAGPPPAYAYSGAAPGPGTWPNQAGAPQHPTVSAGPAANASATSNVPTPTVTASDSTADAIDFNPDAYEDDAPAAAPVAKVAKSVTEECEWTAHNAGEGKGVYYYNVKTGESTWEKPAALKEEDVKAAMSTEAPKPVSWEAIEGCDWQEVKTSDSKVYYYNSTTQATSWSVPDEVRAVRAAKAAKSLEATREALARASSSAEAIAALESTNPLDLVQHKSALTAIPATSNPTPTPAATSTTPPLEDVVEEKNEKEDLKERFREMLVEKGVTPFSRWEKELPKLVFDKRYKDIPDAKERRAIFDHFVRNRAEQVRKEKRASLKAALENFKALLEEMEAAGDIMPEATIEALESKWGSDSRWTGIEPKDREAQLNEVLLPIRKAQEERDGAEARVVEASLRELLIEVGVTGSSRWSKMKDQLAEDPRFTAAPRQRREIVFRAFVAERQIVEEDERRQQEERAREEESRRQREREIRKRKEREGEEIEKRREKAARQDSIAAYQNLLTEQIKDADASWRDSRSRLERDPQGRAVTNDLTDADRERMFREHIASLQERYVADFRTMLKEFFKDKEGTEDAKAVSESWDEAKTFFKGDSRYDRCSRRDREKVYRRLVEDLNRS